MLKNIIKFVLILDKLTWVVILIVSFLMSITNTIIAQRIKVTENEASKSVNITFDGKPFTSYIFPGEGVLKKAVLFPILTAHGTAITRGWPLEPRPSERVDHPHHVGMWLNYEDVNGFDYWNNSTAISPEERLKKYGTIRHIEVIKTQNGAKKGVLQVASEWISADGTGVLTAKENTTFTFSGKGNQRIIDRSTTITAETDILFKDVKDGMIAIRVSRELEIPSKTPEIFTDVNGIETKVPMLNNDGVTGNYRSSEGLEGEAVWGTRGTWVNMFGKIKNEDISVVIIDHPKNVGYPTYWHARGYGLFAANPLGAKIFSKGKEELNLKLKKGESVTFKYRTVVTSSKMTDVAINKLSKEFSKK